MPGRSVRVHPEAVRDVEEGIAFYLNRSQIVAEPFLTEALPGGDAPIRDGSLSVQQHLPRDAQRDPSPGGGTRKAPTAVLAWPPVLKMLRGGEAVSARRGSARHGRILEDESSVGEKTEVIGS